MFGLKKITEIDNKLNYVIGYRNLVNISIVAVAYTAYTMGAFETSVILMILGLKWFAVQVYQNIDAMELIGLSLK